MRWRCVQDEEEEDVRSCRCDENITYGNIKRVMKAAVSFSLCTLPVLKKKCNQMGTESSSGKGGAAEEMGPANTTCKHAH